MIESCVFKCRIMNWFLKRRFRGKQLVSETQLKELLINGKITVDSLVWREGMDQWLPIKDVTVLSSVIRSIPPDFPTKGKRIHRPGLKVSLRTIFVFECEHITRRRFFVLWATSISVYVLALLLAPWEGLKAYNKGEEIFLGGMTISLIWSIAVLHYKRLLSLNVFFQWKWYWWFVLFSPFTIWLYVWIMFGKEDGIPRSGKWLLARLDIENEKEARDLRILLTNADQLRRRFGVDERVGLLPTRVDRSDSDESSKLYGNPVFCLVVADYRNSTEIYNHKNLLHTHDGLLERDCYLLKREASKLIKEAVDLLDQRFPPQSRV